VSLKSLYECFFSLSPSLDVHDVSIKLCQHLPIAKIVVSNPRN